MDDCDRAYENSVTDWLEGRDVTEDEFWAFASGEEGDPCD